MDLYQNRYRIESARLKEWDYSNPWWYFVTINTKDHKEYFGNVVNEEMILNDLGTVASKCWQEIPIHFPNTELDYFIILPNHLHGIVIINPLENKNVEAPYMASLRPLGYIIGKYKAAAKRWANKNNRSFFAWQSRFYDRIIRNEKELFNIRKYIEQNPLKWELEKSGTGNIYDL
ncbi:MAG: transposase [Ignavibacteriales bacterium]|nr:transposase [Ignavibacteriales bacterium]